MGGGSSGGMASMLGGMMGGGQQQHSGGSAQNQYIGMAMAEAGKLFDNQSANGRVVSFPLLSGELGMMLTASTAPRCQQAGCHFLSCADGDEDVHEVADGRQWRRQQWRTWWPDEHGRQVPLSGIAMTYPNRHGGKARFINSFMKRNAGSMTTDDR